MSSVVRVWTGVTLLLVVTLVPAAWAQSEQLQKAVDLYEAQEYVAAQEALLEVDRDALTDEERTQLDHLLEQLPQAIQGAERAQQDLAAADAAYEEGAWELAQEQYEAVLDNEYAQPAQRSRSSIQLMRIEEKQALAEAARPSEPLDTPEELPEEPAEQPQEPAPEPQTAPAAEPAPMPIPEQQGTPRRMTPADEVRLRDALLWQQAEAKADALAAEARQAVLDHDFSAARKLAEAALQMVESARNHAEPVSKYLTARQRMLDLKEEVVRAQEEWEQTTAAEEREEIAERVRVRKQLIEQQKAEKIQQLFNTAQQLRRERRYAEAAEVYREILRIDPANVPAQQDLNWAEDFASIEEQKEWQHNLYVQTRNALVKAEQALIPWDIDVMYPENFRELARNRQRWGVSTGRFDEDPRLAQTLPDTRFEEQPFDQVMEFLGELTQVNISVDWTDIEDSGIERDAPVSLELSGLLFRVVLEEVLTQVGGDVRLAYAFKDDLLRVATKDKLDRDKLVNIYDIRDLLVRVPRASRQNAFDVTQGMGETGGQGGGGGGQGMFGQGQQNQQDDYDDEQQAGMPAEEIIDIIRQTVEPDSWRETGGGDASIRDLNGQLIIFNTSNAHRQVGNLLEQLRRFRAMQISVETRFLDVTSNFLEEFGVDLDFVFNSGSAGYDQAYNTTGAAISDPATGGIVLVPRQYSRIGAYPAVPAFGQQLPPGTVPQQPYSQAGFVPASGSMLPTGSNFTPIGASQSSRSIVQGAPQATRVPGSFGAREALQPALQIAGSFLDNLQVDFLIRATQANARSSVVQAPRLVLFNGQASTISIGSSRQYVSSLEPRLAEGAVGFQPQTASADAGVSMWVEGTISADRKYVTLTLNVQQRQEPTFETVEVQRASGNSPGSFITLPTQEFARLETTVSIPDGGTVLLGGLKQVGEIEVAAGVPILSKIPILKRAFTNETTIKDTRTLLILVKTKIIIQEEAEEEAFPGFTRSGI